VLTEVLSSHVYRDSDFDPETGRSITRR